MKLPKAEDLNFNIDNYINQYIPPSQLYRLPYPISRFLGYRKSPERRDVGNLLVCIWSFVGAFCGLAVVVGVFNSSPLIQQDHPPLLIASFGASAILEYNAIRTSLGQPRNCILGHVISATLGVGITKLFKFRSDFESIRWVAGAVSCGVASGAMVMTNTIHPPGGATAVLAATQPNVTDMGWHFVPLILLGSTLMLLVGLIINNIQRQFPVYWWTPDDLRREKDVDVEKLSEGITTTGEKQPDAPDFSSDLYRFTVTADCVTVPDQLSLSREEVKVLEGLRDRLREQRSSRLHRRPSTTLSTGCISMIPTHETHSQSALTEPAIH
ncbi:hypothetical protein AOQ84DRAFT_356130 [Glonium stellatum]|uniref:HPP transmembrane region domain-containing protein n=1 Tax=Glonium stellatum TaxID=574774 RepID=A0A8E2EUB6_9PEZI|nr:hypothetical protein AOQ84DRAFT_356130 [Glonium stellatum]